MLIQVNFNYRKYWKKWARFKPSTSTYSLFLMRLESDHVYKRHVDTYIHSTMTPVQQQWQLCQCLNF